jgi:hypothetical protein
VELPSGNAYRKPLLGAIRSGAIDGSLVDRALQRVLLQKAELGLLDARFDDPLVVPETLDPTDHRDIARRLAEEAVILLANDGTLPLARPGRIAVIGPNADRPTALFGCYSFANHVLDRYPDVALGIEVASVLDALRVEFDGSSVTHAQGCGVDDPDPSGIEAAVAAARDADVAVLVVGDRAGLFGRGTSGEGCDTDSLELPGIQRDLVEAVLATGTPVVLVLVTGRPYAIGWAAGRCAAIVQAFFPGEEGASAIAGVVSGRIDPSGRLPVSMPRSAASQPYSYIHPKLAGPSSVSNIDTEPVFPFGFGLSYTTFERTDLSIASATVPTDGTIEASVRVRNAGQRAGADVVQIYGSDPVATVTRPVAQLLGFARVDLAPGESAIVRFRVPTTRLAFSGRDLVRGVEPGAIELWVGSSCAARDATVTLELVGPWHPIDASDARWVDVTVEPSMPAVPGIAGRVT